MKCSGQSAWRVQILYQKVPARIPVTLGRKAAFPGSFLGSRGPADPPRRSELQAEAAQLAEKLGQWPSVGGSAAQIQDGLGLPVQNSPIS